MHSSCTLVKEGVLSSLLTVTGYIFKDSLEMMLTHASINVFCMAKEEYHQRKVQNLMKFPLVSILARTIGNDLCHQLAHGKKQLISITWWGFRPEQWWTTLVHCVKHKKVLKQCHKLFQTALHLDRSLACWLLHYVPRVGLIIGVWLVFFGVWSMSNALYWNRIQLFFLCHCWCMIQYWQLVDMFNTHPGGLIPIIAINIDIIFLETIGA